VGQALAGLTVGVDGKPPLVLLHAFPLDGRMWEPQQEELNADRRILVPDLMGFGRSPLPKGPHSIEDHARDVADFLDAHAVSKAILCGLSMGGYVALAFAALFPYRLAGLILADTRATADPASSREGRTAATKRLQSEGMVFLADDMLFKLLAPETLRSNPELSRRVWSIMVSQRREGVGSALLALRDRPNRLEELADIRCPALVVVGSDDAVTPPVESAAMAELIPGARLEQIEGAAHLSNLENPGAFNRIIRDFIAPIKE
jgi:3-oxoadipate enol-lactonase